MGAFINMTRQRIGRLLVVSPAGRDGWGEAIWNCLCSCGTEVVVRGVHLRNGNTTSCGCRRADVTRERMTRHGQARRGKKTAEYRVWKNMIKRCTRVVDRDYKHYGGRGITVCDRWLNDFAVFFADMGPKPFPRAQLDREHNDGNYEPDNCRWTTKRVNARNTRRNHFYDTPWGRMLLSDAAVISGICANTLKSRIVLYKWPPDRWFDPVRRKDWYGPSI